jgi:hypothetical protein
MSPDYPIYYLNNLHQDSQYLGKDWLEIRRIGRCIDLAETPSFQTTEISDQLFDPSTVAMRQELPSTSTDKTLSDH